MGDLCVLHNPQPSQRPLKIPDCDGNADENKEYSHQFPCADPSRFRIWTCLTFHPRVGLWLSRGIVEKHNGTIHLPDLAAIDLFLQKSAGFEVAMSVEASFVKTVRGGYSAPARNCDLRSWQRRGLHPLRLPIPQSLNLV
jgi:hypothetical protein